MRFKDVSLSRVQDQVPFRVADGRFYIPDADYINEEYTIIDISPEELEAFKDLFSELEKRHIPFTCSYSISGEMNLTVENTPGFCLADEMKNKQLRLP